MPFFHTLSDVFEQLCGPWGFIFLSFQHIPQTVKDIVSSGEYSKLFWPSEFKEALFGNFWATVGPEVKNNGVGLVVPLLEGRVKDGIVHDEVVVEPVSGVVIEVGAGSGMWADVFARIGAGTGDLAEGAARRRKATSSPGTAITKIYGVEPNPQSATALRKRVKEVGLGEVYEVVPVGIEDVDDPSKWDGKIEPGSVDCIVCILCLCSIPEPEKNIKLLYKLLKPGGRWYFNEHVKTYRGGPLMSLYQRFVNIFWSFFVGSCRLCRDTKKSLLEAGPWQQVNLAYQPGGAAYEVMPHILGTLKK